MHNPKRIRILLVDDHTVVRAGYRRFLEQESDCQVIAEASSGEEAYILLQTVEPEIFSLDAEPELKAQTMAWKERRDDFMKKFNAKDAATLKEAWQRYYFIGKMPDGSLAAQHLHKLRLDAPVDKRSKPAKS